MIPKILHTVWIGNQKPNVDYSNTWNVFDGWEVIHWDDDLIRKSFDDPFLKKLYSNEGPTKISDYVRLLILKKYGGVYSDKDVFFIKPIDEFLNRKSFLTYQFFNITEPKQFLPRGEKLSDHFEGKNKTSLFEYYNEDIYLNNSIIGSTKDSNLINKFIEVYIEDYNKPEIERFSYIDYGCGPAMTTYVGNMFTKLDGNTKHTEDVSIYDASHFHPYNYIENRKSLRTRDFTRNVQNQINKGIELGSFCVHIQSSSECDNYRKK